MNTTPQPTNPTMQSTPGPARRGRGVTIAVSIFGALILIAIIIGLLVTAITTRPAVNETTTMDVTGVTALDVDVSAGEFTLDFADVDEATIEMVNARNTWELRRDGDTLRVHTPREFWNNFCFIWCEHQQVTVILPESLQDSGLDAELSLSAGALRAYGDFAELDLEVSAGELTINGTAETVRGDVSAGELNGTLTDIREGHFTVSAGSTKLSIDGNAPDLLDLDVSAGSIDLRVPDVEYDIATDVSAGGVDHNLRTRSDARHEITVQVSAGSVSLRA